MGMPKLAQAMMKSAVKREALVKREREEDKKVVVKKEREEDEKKVTLLRRRCGAGRPAGAASSADGGAVARRAVKAAFARRWRLAKGVKSEPVAPVKKQILKKEPSIRQQRFGIRLKTGESSSKSGWLVPPTLMSAKLVTATKKGHIRSGIGAWQQRMDASSSTGKTRVAVASKQSGVVGVWYHPKNAWVAKWHARSGTKQKYFSVRSFVSRKKTWKQAEAKALKEAVKFRQRLFNCGKIKIINQHGRRAKRISGVRGVTWHNMQHCWNVRIQSRGKTFRGDRFLPVNDSEDAIERARLLAIASRKRLEREHFDIRRRLPTAAPRGGA